MKTPKSLAEILQDHYTVDETQAVLSRSRKQIYIYAEQYQWRSMKFEGLRFFHKEDVAETKRLLDSR